MGGTNKTIEMLKILSLILICLLFGVVIIAKILEHQVQLENYLFIFNFLGLILGFVYFHLNYTSRKEKEKFDYINTLSNKLVDEVNILEDFYNNLNSLYDTQETSGKGDELSSFYLKTEKFFKLFETYKEHLNFDKEKRKEFIELYSLSSHLDYDKVCKEKRSRILSLMNNIRVYCWEVPSKMASS